MKKQRLLWVTSQKWKPTLRQSNRKCDFSVIDNDEGSWLGVKRNVSIGVMLNMAVFRQNISAWQNWTTNQNKEEVQISPSSGIKEKYADRKLTYILADRGIICAYTSFAFLFEENTEINWMS